MTLPAALMDQLPALQVVLPLLGALLAAILRHGGAGYVIALAVSWTMPVIAFLILGQVQAVGTISYAMGGWVPPIGIEYRIDEANAFILVLVSLMGALVMSYAPRVMAAEIPAPKRGLAYAMYLTALCGLLGMAITGDAFNIFVFTEISSLASYVLISLGRDRRALVAAFQYLIIGTTGATFYVIGIGLLFAMTGTLNLQDLATSLPAAMETIGARPVIAALAFVVVGIGLKLAIFPLHLWLPNAYAFAPTAMTVFLASTATKVAIYLLLRLVFSVFGIELVFGEFPTATVLFALAVAGMLIPSIVAIYQKNVKRMFAYSSVAQVGYMILGIALASEAGLTGGISHMFNHAVVKAGVFMAIGCLVYSVGCARIDDYAGVGRSHPAVMWAFVICGAGLIGVPGTAGFVSKYYLVTGALEQDLWLLAAVIMASSVLAVLYVGKVIEVAWFRAPPEGREIRAVPFEMLALTWVMAAATIYFGFFTDLSAGVANDAARSLIAGWR